MSLVAAVANHEGIRMGLVLTAFGLGLRHGVDWDHIAAITDITGTQNSSRRSLLLSTLYALGHGLVVFGLGVVAVLAGDLIPAGVDRLMEKVVGVTLVLLGFFVFFSLVRSGRDFRMRSRWMLVFSGAARGVRWARERGRNPLPEEIEHDHDHGPSHGHHEHPADPAWAGHTHGTVEGTGGAPAAVSTETATLPRTHRHRHSHRGELPPDPFLTYGRGSAFAVGMVHGIGAETPTQVVLFLAAAQAGGAAAGVFLLAVFVLGLLASNSLIAVLSTFGFLSASRSFAVYAGVAVVTGVMSLLVGALFLAGRGSLLPAFFGG